jgi:hypothetical protein
MKKICISVIALGFVLSALSQNKSQNISGYVYDNGNNAPLIGVNIYIGGTQTGTTTNSDGFFSLKIKKFPVQLFFSYLGYELTQYMVKSEEINSLRIFLKPEIHEIGEVTISGERIIKLIKGDTLNIVDYEISDDQVILLANPYKVINDQRLYLTTLSGEILSDRKIRNAGHPVKVSESLAVRTDLYLFKDCFRNIHLLTSDKVWQVFVHENNLYLIYPSHFDDFMSLLYPVKAALHDRLVLQKATQEKNETFLIAEGWTEYQLIKTVSDPAGPYRYAKPIDFLESRPWPVASASEFISKGSYQKCVTAPVIQRSEDIAVFDFFDNTIDFFNAEGALVKSVPITFHLKEYYELIIFKRHDIDQENFTQQVLYDEKAKQLWSVWRQKKNGRYTLKEINPDTGEVVRVIDIPEYPFIDKIQVHNNIVFFLYQEKKYPYYRSLYRMVI